MNILLAFTPFLVFVLFERLGGTFSGLVTAAVAAFAMIIRDQMRGRGSWKVLEIGTVLLFSGLALYVMATGDVWSISEVRLRVDAGLLAIVLLSLAIRTPFTLQYAREQSSRELWKEPAFVKANYKITLAWAAAFAVLVAADLLLIYKPELPVAIGVSATIVALAAAVRFTASYPNRIQVPSRN